MTRLRPILLVLSALIAATPTRSASAETCALAAVTARGEPASFQWLAVTKARANWRSRVRITKSLGPAYSTWSLAQNRTEDCQPGPRGMVCTFSAIPCRP